MRNRSTTLFACAALVVLAASCAETTSATPGAAPVPPIELAIPGLPAELSGSAEARVISPQSIDTVVMIGDSITVGSLEALQTAYQRVGFSDIVIQSLEGKRTAVTSGNNPSGTSIAEFLIGVGPTDAEPADAERTDDLGGDVVSDHSNELWVIALGTNDINQYPGQQEWAAAVEEMMAIVPSESPLVWVDTYYRDQSDGASLVNSTIAAAVRGRGNSAVAQWSAVAGTDGYLRGDGVHPRPEGSEAFAATIIATITSLLGLS